MIFARTHFVLLSLKHQERQMSLSIINSSNKVTKTSPMFISMSYLKGIGREERFADQSANWLLALSVRR